MKKSLYTLAAILLIIVAVFIGQTAEANLDLFKGFPKASVEVNGEMIEDTGVPPIIIEDRVMIPINQAAELLNAYTEWDEARKVVMLKKPVVNMTVIKELNNTSIQINPTFKAGTTNNFEVATQVSRVPLTEELKTRFVVVDRENQTIYSGRTMTINTKEVDGNFIGNLSVANLTFSSKGTYTLKLQMEDLNEEGRFITIGECELYVQ